MAEKKSFIDRFIERVDSIDGGSLQAYLLRLSRDKGFFATILNAVDDGILVIDRALRIRYHNKTARELLGLPADLSRVRLSHFLRNVDWPAVIQQNVAEWTRLLREEVEIFYPAHRFLRLYLVPQELDGESCAIVILHDVTEQRKRTTEELRNGAAEAVSLLAAGVAHEIGNPLNSLYLNLQLIDRELSDSGVAPESGRMVKSCMAEVERLDNIIHQFLHAIRPGFPKLEPASLVTAVMETLDFMRREFELRQAQVTFDAPDAVPEVMADVSQLKQAFYNILKNSLEAISNGGHISIKCCYSPETVDLTFSDDGCGVTPDQLSSMFQAFKTFKPGGNGLGMMIVQRILTEHGATFGVSGGEGEGFSFQARFPRRDRVFAQLPENAGKERV